MSGAVIIFVLSDGCDGGGGAQRPVLRVKKHEKTGARSGPTRSAAKSPKTH